MRIAVAISISLLLALPLSAAEEYRFIFNGDSITQNNPWNLTNNWFTGHTLTKTNIARGGWALGDLFTYFDSPGFPSTGQGDVIDNLAASPTINIVYVHIGANDLTYPTSGSLMVNVLDNNGATWFAHLTNLWWKIRTNATAQGKIVRVIGSTITPAGSGITFDYNTNGTDYLTKPAGWTNINNLIRSNTVLLDYFCDNATVLPNTKGTGYEAGDGYGDTVIHPSLVGMRLIVSNLNAVLELADNTRYVDCLATNSLNTGLSWANAWTNMLPLHEDSNNVPAGATVYISGGDYLRTNQWTNVFEAFPLENGTSGNVITYRHASSPLEVSSNVTIHSTLGLKGYTTLDGSRVAGYETNIGGNTFNVPLITNNIAIVLDSRDMDFRDQAFHLAVFLRNNDPIIVKWVGVIGLLPAMGDVVTFENNSQGQNRTKFANGGASDDPHVEIAYIWMQNYDMAFAISGSTTNEFGTVNVHHSLMETNLQGYFDNGYGPSVDLHHSIFRNKALASYRHTEADGFQASGSPSFGRIHHNIIEPTDNDLGVITMYSDFTNWFWYCNLIQPRLPTSHFTNNPTEGLGNIRIEPSVIDGLETNGLAMPSLILGGVFFVNNTIVMRPEFYSVGGGFQFSLTDTNTRNPRWASIPPGGLVFKNNLEHGCSSTATIATEHILGGVTNGSIISPWRYNTNSVLFDYNVWSTTNAKSVWLVWTYDTNAGLINLTNANTISTALGYTNNTNLSATFYDETGRDYRPTLSSLVMGENLTSLTNIMPDLDKDLYGNQRPATGPWTVGAIEYGVPPGTMNGLVLWLWFDRSDMWTNGGYIPDHSGWTNHAYIFDPPEWFAAHGVHTAPTLTNGPNALSAGDFKINYTGPDGFSSDENEYDFGQYAGVTNFGGGWQTLTQATWCGWANVNTNTGGGHLGSFGFLDSGLLYTNSWCFGTWYSGEPSLLLFTNNLADSHFHAIVFPMPSEPYGFIHYAVTWDGETFIGYTNGVPYQTNANSPQFPVLVSTNSHGEWVSVGTLSHGGTPDRIDVDGLPNNGQMNGPMADLRIYNRALTAAEVLQIYGGSGEAEPPATPASHATINNVTIGTLILR